MFANVLQIKNKYVIYIAIQTLYYEVYPVYIDYP
jgi:hypothetical protein